MPSPFYKHIKKLPVQTLRLWHKGNQVHGMDITEILIRSAGHYELLAQIQIPRSSIFNAFVSILCNHCEWTPSSSADKEYVNIPVLVLPSADKDYVNIPVLDLPSADKDYVNIPVLDLPSADKDYVNIPVLDLPSALVLPHQRTCPAGSVRCGKTHSMNAIDPTKHTHTSVVINTTLRFALLK